MRIAFSASSVSQKLRVILYVAQFLQTSIYAHGDVKEAYMDVKNLIESRLLLTRRNVKGREKRNAAIMAGIQVFRNGELVQRMFTHIQEALIAHLQQIIDKGDSTSDSEPAPRLCISDVNRIGGHFAAVLRFILGVFRCESEFGCTLMRARVYMYIWLR